MATICSRTLVWWHDLAEDIEQVRKKCRVCGSDGGVKLWWTPLTGPRVRRLSRFLDYLSHASGKLDLAGSVYCTLRTDFLITCHVVTQI